MCKSLLCKVILTFWTPASNQLTSESETQIWGIKSQEWRRWITWKCTACCHGLALTRGLSLWLSHTRVKWWWWLVNWKNQWLPCGDIVFFDILRPIASGKHFELQGDCTDCLVGGNLSPDRHGLTCSDCSLLKFANNCHLIYKSRPFANMFQSTRVSLCQWAQLFFDTSLWSRGHDSTGYHMFVI